MKALLVAVVAGGALFPAAASADTTPAGPATLINEFRGASTSEGRGPEVLVAARVTVAPGGQAGPIRIRASYGGVHATGDPVQLPAEPGTYEFPAPHIRWDYRGGQLGFEQTTGGHAVLTQAACRPDMGRFADPCQILRVNIFSPEGVLQQAVDGARLDVVGVFEPDRDQDLVGDTSEDRTDLRLSAQPSRGADGKLRVALTIANVGPRAADVPQLRLPEGVTLEGGCKPVFWFDPANCAVGRAIAAGEAHTVTLLADNTDAVRGSVTVVSEGIDLADSDNTAPIQAAAAAPFALAATKAQRLSKGVKVQVSGIRDGRVKVSAAIRRGGKTVTLSKVVTLKSGQQRTVTLKAKGAKLRSVRRLAGRRTVKASVTVRALEGTQRTSTATTVRV